MNILQKKRLTHKYQKKNYPQYFYPEIKEIISKMKNYNNDQNEEEENDV